MLTAALHPGCRWGSRARQVALSGNLPLFVFFVGIGLRLYADRDVADAAADVFLGHPTYGLSVVLFTLLLSSGLGSYLTQRISDRRVRQAGTRRLPALIGGADVFGVLTPA